MKTYLAKFHGRKVGAIGITYDIEARCYGNDPVEAHLELYNRYEHINRWELTEIPNAVCDKCKHIISSDPHECPSAEYQDAKSSLMRGAIEAMEEFSEDELEDYANGTNQHLY